MRINENFHDGCGMYTNQTRRRVAHTFREASQIAEFKGLLAEIGKNSDAIRELFLTEEDLRERQKISAKFDSEMQTTITCITQNLEAYQQEEWKMLFGKGENGDE